MSAPVLPTSGDVADGAHRFPIRVYYEDTDAGGIVYHANYLRFAERARSECLRLVGWEHERMLRDTGLGWVVRHAAIDFKKPARLDDALVVETRLAEARGARMMARQTLLKDGELLVAIDLELVLLTAAGRPGRIPASLVDALRPFLLSSPPK